MKNIIFIGPPCSGKGTHSQIISNLYKFEHISTGDILREEILNKTNIGKIAKQLIDKGMFVSDSIALKIVYKKITHSLNNLGFLFDGFPRTINQAEIIEKYLKKNNLKIDVVFYLNTSQDILKERMLKRAVDDNRADDNEEIFDKRISEYQKNTFPLYDFYKKQNLLHEINTTDKIELVSEIIIKKLKEL